LQLGQITQVLEDGYSLVITVGLARGCVPEHSASDAVQLQLH
jgi:hypothetical protein